MRRHHPLAGLLLLLNVWCAQAQEMAITVLPLQHALLQDVLPVLQPLLADGGTLTGMNNQLVIKTTPENLQQLRDVLARIDHAPRQLKIYVRHGVISGAQRQSASAGVRVNSGDVRVRTAPVQEDARVSVGNDHVRVDAGVSAQQTRHHEHSGYFVSALEGRPAWISSGVAAPINTTDVYYTPEGVLTRESSIYVHAQSGFYVLPTVNGDVVTLQIAPQKESFAPASGSIQSSGAHTQVHGRLGEWIALGGISESSHYQDRQGLRRSQSAVNSSQNISVMVVEAQ